MSARLTASYRSWVRWYPAPWRAANAEAMLGVYLDVADEQGRNRLTAPEKWSIVASGLATRFNAVLPARVRDGVATGALALLGALGAVVLFFFEWAPFWSYQVPEPAPSACSVGFGEGCVHYLSSFGPFASVVGIVACLAVLTGGLAFLRNAVLTRIMLALTAASGVAAAIAIHAGPFLYGARPPLEAPLFFALVALAALLGRPIARRRPSLALGVWTLAWLVILGLAWGAFDHGRAQLGSGAQGFFLDVIGRDIVADGITLALLGALVLAAASRTTAALVVVASTVIWVPLWLQNAIATDYRGFEWRWPEVFAALGYLLVAAVFLGRRTGRRAAQ